jgi:hypothetical protein
LQVARVHLATGSRCFVVGKLEGREYNGKYYTSVVAEEVFPLVGGEQPRQEQEPWQAAAGKEIELDDIPF